MTTIPNPYDVAASAILTYGALQKPGELAGLLEVVDNLFPSPGPRSIVEIGSDAGGTLFAWAACWPNAQRLSVTLIAGPFAASNALEPHGADLIEFDSHDPRTLELVRATFPTGVDVLFVDGDHTFAGCAQDVNNYGALVRVGGVLILHDICHHELPNVGVERVWAELDSARWEKAAEIIEPPATWGGIGVAVKC